jgi:ornithine carbamoyltransferase
MRFKLKIAINQNFALVIYSDLFMSHTQVQVCIKLDNLVGEKYQLISKSIPRTVKNKYTLVHCLL